MAMEYAYKADRPTLGGTVASGQSILPGELVTAAEGGGISLTAGSDGRTDGVVEDFADAHIAENQYDYRGSLDAFTYDAGMMIQFAGYEDGAYLRVKTPEDNGTDPAPNIDEWSVVGIPDIGGYEGRVVEEGYTDAGAVTYDRAGGNFLPVGIARASSPKVPQTGFDSFTHVIVRRDL